MAPRFRALVVALFLLTSPVLIFLVPSTNSSGLPQTSVPGQQIASDPSRQMIYYINVATGSVLFINSTSEEVVASVPVGSDPTALDISPDNSLLFVTLPSSNIISVLDLSTHTILRNLTLGFSPLSISASSGDRLFVSSAVWGDGTIY